MVNLFILSWLFVIGLIVTTFSSGPLYLYTFEKRDIGLWNKPWFNCGNQSWTFLSFLSSSSLEKGLFIDSLFPIRGDLVFNHCGEKSGGILVKKSKRSCIHICFKVQYVFGLCYKTLAQILENVMNKHNIFEVWTSACMDATRYDDWPPIYQKPIRSWPSKPLMEPYNFIEENPLAKWDLLKRPGCWRTNWRNIYARCYWLGSLGYNEQLLHVTDLPSRLYT